MKKFLLTLLVLTFSAALAAPSYAKSENSADGKAVGHGEKGERGSSANAPGQTGDTGKDNAPGQNK